MMMMGIQICPDIKAYVYMCMEESVPNLEEPRIKIFAQYE